jgi:glyoxylase-like metal-dependent hydrolase (beta-lactamase superfamily II)
MACVPKERAFQLVPGVWRIPLLRDFVNGFILRDDDGQVTLIDMGITRSGPKVMAVLASIGSGPSDVTRLMLTHATPTTRRTSTRRAGC